MAFEIPDFVCLKMPNSNELTSFVQLILFSVKEGNYNSFSIEIGHIFSCFLWYDSGFETVLKTLNSHVPFIPVLQRQRQRQGHELEASWSI